MFTSTSETFAFLKGVEVDDESTVGAASLQLTMVIAINATLPNETAALERFVAGKGPMSRGYRPRPFNLKTVETLQLAHRVALRCGQDV